MAAREIHLEVEPGVQYYQLLEPSNAIVDLSISSTSRGETSQIVSAESTTTTFQFSSDTNDEEASRIAQAKVERRREQRREDARRYRLRCRQRDAEITTLNARVTELESENHVLKGQLGVLKEVLSQKFLVYVPVPVGTIVTKCQMPPMPPSSS